MPNCWGLVLLLLALPAGAASVSLAWDASPSTVSQYIVHWGTFPGVYTSHESAGMALTKTIPDLPDGVRHYFAVTAKGVEGDSDFSNEISYRQSFSNPPVRILLQSEFATLEAPFVTKTDSSAMTGGYAVSTNTDAGTCTFRVTVPFLDEYVMWARVMSSHEGADSLYVSINNQAEDVYDTVRVRKPEWQWTQVNGRGGIDKPLEASHAIDPRFFIMEGFNRVQFRGREQGTGLDAVLITNDKSFIPKAPSIPDNLQLTGEQ